VRRGLDRRTRRGALPSLLPGLISRADVLGFAVDCISHDAVATIMRLCRQLEKPYQPLRINGYAR
jgi:hypothetical protein